MLLLLYVNVYLQDLLLYLDKEKEYMTETLLAQANALQNRIKSVELLLEQVDLTDPSGADTTERISPIIIQAGMAQSIQFDVLPADVDMPISETQRLDAHIHAVFVQLLQDYLRQLKEMFDKLN